MLDAMATAERHVFSHGMRDTRAALADWNRAPWRALREWVPVSVAVAAALLAAVWLVAGLLTPDLTPVRIPGFTEPARPGDMAPILWRNSLVLALHGTACVAGFIAGASMPIAAAQRTGLSRRLHIEAGRFAILFVTAVTLFSLATQALYLGLQCATISHQLGISRGALIASVLPHALPELTALFLPLAAWLVAGRRGEWNRLLAATFATVALACPVLLATAALEVWLWPQLLDLLGASQPTLRPL